MKNKKNTVPLFESLRNPESTFRKEALAEWKEYLAMKEKKKQTA